MFYLLVAGIALLLAVVAVELAHHLFTPELPAPHRPIKRYKRKIRGVRVARNGKPHKKSKKAEQGVRYVSYLRLYPNFGFQLGKFHWCRAKHTRGH